MKEYEMIIDSNEVITAVNLAEFLYFFSAVYGAATKLNELPAERIIARRHDFARDFSAFLHSEYSAAGVGTLISESLGEQQLIITKVKKESPLEFWFMGVSSALVIAVVLSGGEVDLLKGKFKLPALGEGVRKLKQAFGLSTTRDQALQKLKADYYHRTAPSGKKPTAGRVRRSMVSLVKPPP